MHIQAKKKNYSKMKARKISSFDKRAAIQTQTLAQRFIHFLIKTICFHARNMQHHDVIKLSTYLFTFTFSRDGHERRCSLPTCTNRLFSNEQISSFCALHTKKKHIFFGQAGRASLINFYAHTYMCGECFFSEH